MSNPWDTIVVGTDGSSRAGKAVEHAGHLAAATESPVVVVTAYDPDPPSRPDPPDRIPEDVRWATMPATAAEETATKAAAVAREAGAPRARGRAAAGFATTALLDTARESGRAPLIVVGSKGMGSPSRFLLGSVPNNIAHHADCDVLIVRTD